LEPHLTVVLSLIVVLGIGAQWLAWRLKVPAIVLLLVFGALAGPGFRWIRPSQDLGAMLGPIVKLGVAVILFEGGPNLRFQELRHSGTGIVRLATLGVLLSFLLGGYAAHWVGGLSWPVALVLGAIIVITGPTVILPLLRQARLRKRPAAYLKWEGIITDPVGALLAATTFQYFMFGGEGALPQVALRLGAGLLAAGVLGVGCGLVLGAAFRRGWAPDYLKGPVALGAALAVYVLANRVLNESGLLAATLLGAVLFVVRPLSIFLSTLNAGMTLPERGLLAWIAPRGS
jgi:NhaP-type Na+/H+ or K+/H+ antiporter